VLGHSKKENPNNKNYYKLSDMEFKLEFEDGEIFWLPYNQVKHVRLVKDYLEAQAPLARS
jgi:acetylglutamate synthase